MCVCEYRNSTCITVHVHVHVHVQYFLGIAVSAVCVLLLSFVIVNRSSAALRLPRFALCSTVRVTLTLILVIEVAKC